MGEVVHLERQIQAYFYSREKKNETIGRGDDILVEEYEMFIR